MPLELIPFENPTLKLADTEAGLATGTAFECQLTTAELIATQNMVSVEQTPCAAPSQIPGKPSWALHLIWYQDWTAPAGGLSGYAYEHQGDTVWFELAIDAVNAPTVKATGQVRVGTGGYGGLVSPTPVKSDVQWPCTDTPVIVTPVTAAAAAAEGETSEPQPAAATAV